MEESSAHGTVDAGSRHGGALFPGGGIWPIDPDPRLTGLRGRQAWHFSDGRPVAAEVAHHRVPAGDARIIHLGVRRDSLGHPYPAAFAHAAATGHVLHHAHGAGLRRLPVSLDVCAIDDAGALSCTTGRCICGAAPGAAATP